MGEIAEDMVGGWCCMECGIYFESEHGYPVLCKSCKANSPDSDLPEAIIPELGE